MNKTVTLDDGRGALVIIDQTLLPGREELLYLTGIEEIRDAIRELKVRGAPAIGVAAAIGLYLEAKAIAKGMDAAPDAAAYPKADIGEFFQKLRIAKDRLASARPTAVNLSWALNRMECAALDCAGSRTERNALDSAGSRTGRNAPDCPGGTAIESAVHGRDGVSVTAILVRLRAECLDILHEDEQVCASIGRHGLGLLQPGMRLLTHCNAGRLATASVYGTATAPMYLGHEQGYKFSVYCDETRPLLQGARLTAYELTAAGIDTTLICDNMAPSLMSAGRIDAVLVGCDRVAANGDAANKIGTSYVAIAAKHYGVPFYICAPTSTIDYACENGSSIVIEQRDADEVTEMWYASRVAPAGVKVFNPAFDVTDAGLITAIITENGVVYPPYRESLAALKSSV